MFNAWHDLPVDRNNVAESIPAVIEVPRHSKVKYELHKKSGMIMVDRILHSAVHYPANYGLIPQTYCDDNDPLDVLVLGEHPLVPLTIVHCRPVGVMRMIDGGELDDKIIAVPTDDPVWKHITKLSEVPQHILDEICEFFKTYKTLEKKKAVEIKGVEDEAAAVACVEEALDLYAGQADKLRG